MKARLLSGYGIRRQDKEGQQSLDIEVITERTGQSLCTDRQLVIRVNDEEFMRLELDEKGWLNVAVNPVGAVTPRFRFPGSSKAETFDRFLDVEVEGQTTEERCGMRYKRNGRRIGPAGRHLHLKETTR